MTLSTAGFEADITALVATKCARVFDTQVPDNQPTPAMPYVILQWVEPTRTATDHHLTGVRDDTMRGAVVVQITSSTAASAKDVKNLLAGVLTGYRPTDCGELIPEGGSSYSIAEEQPKPTRFIRELYYSFITNQNPNE